MMMDAKRALAVRCWRETRAVAAVEFAIVGPVFLFLLFAVLGVGLDGFYQLTLDDSVREAARQIQVDGPAATSPAGFANAVCREFGVLAQDCVNQITFSVQASPLATAYNVDASPATAGFGALSPATLSASGAFGSSASNGSAFFSNGTAYADNVSVLVQVAYKLPFDLPYVDQLVTYTGTDSIVAAATIRAEPF